MKIYIIKPTSFSIDDLTKYLSSLYLRIAVFHILKPLNRTKKYEELKYIHMKSMHIILHIKSTPAVVEKLCLFV